jgi:hypothetical protein
VSNVSALITAIAALCTAAAGLIAALTPLFRGVRSAEPKPPKATEPAEDAKPYPPVSRRTTESLALCGIAAGLAVGLILLVHDGWAGRHTGVASLMLAGVGVLVLFGAGVGVERAWTAWARERLLAINAAVGPVVGIVAWLMALITISPIWQLPTT